MREADHGTVRALLLAGCALVAACARDVAPVYADARAVDAAMSADGAADAGVAAPVDAALAPVLTADADVAAPVDAAVIAPDAAVRDAGPAPFDPLLWQRSVIYFALTDRFANGDASNDGSADCYDPTSPRRFHGGDFAGLAAHLDYLEELGADALWITPVPAQVPRRGESCGYHGYWADLDDPDDGRVEPRLGGEAGLTALIDAVHARGLRLVLDMVVNHPGRDARLTRTHSAWFHPADGCAALGDPTVYCSLSGLPDFAHEQPEVAAYLDAHSVAWARRFDFDGVRMDTVKHVPVDYFRDHWIPAMTGERPRLYLLGEIFDDSGYALHARYRAAGFHGFFDFPLRGALIEGLAHRGSLRGAADRVRQAVSELGLPMALLKSNFLDNHDVGRFTREFDASFSTAEKVERYRLALAMVFFSPGIPQIYAGDELGAAHADSRVDHPAWAFDPATRSGARADFLGDPAQTFAWVRQLAALRRAVPALHAGRYVELWHPDARTELVAFYRQAGASRAVVVVNAGGELRDHVLPVDRNGQLDAADHRAMADGAVWTERVGTRGAALTFAGGVARVSAPARSVAVFVE